jgi:TonB family protein
MRTAAPDYPRVAERAGVVCDLQVVARIDEAGNAEPLRASQTCPYFQQDFERAAFAALRRWRFEPARDQAGAPVAVEHEVTIHFAR